MSERESLDPVTANRARIGSADGQVTVDIDGVLVLAHSEKRDATAIWKTFGHHLWGAFVDHGQAVPGSRWPRCRAPAADRRPTVLRLARVPLHPAPDSR